MQPSNGSRLHTYGVIGKKLSSWCLNWPPCVLLPANKHARTLGVAAGENGAECSFRASIAYKAATSHAQLAMYNRPCSKKQASKQAKHQIPTSQWYASAARV
jgi:hypothetical protein